MDKKSAIIILSQNGIPVNHRNVVFSNVNATVPVWWLEPNNDKLKSGLYMVLNHNTRNILYVFSLPAGSFANPEEKFYQRNDKNCSHLEIKIDNELFVDKKSKTDFSSFLIKKIMY